MDNRLPGGKIFILIVGLFWFAFAYVFLVLPLGTIVLNNGAKLNGVEIEKPLCFEEPKNFGTTYSRALEGYTPTTTESFSIAIDPLIEKIQIQKVSQQTDVSGSGAGSGSSATLLGTGGGSYNMSFEISSTDYFIFYSVTGSEQRIERNKIPFNFSIYEDTVDEAYLLKVNAQLKTVTRYKECYTPNPGGLIEERTSLTGEYYYELHVPPGTVANELR